MSLFQAGVYTVPELPNGGFVIEFNDWDIGWPSPAPDLILEIGFDHSLSGQIAATTTTLTVIYSSTAGDFALRDPEGNAVWTELKSKVGQSFSYATYEVIPEPASLVLLGVGGLAVLRRRR